MAVATTAILGGITAAAAIAGAGASVIGAMQANKKPKTAPIPTFNANQQQKKIATQEAEANKKRILSESETIQTSALGNTQGTETKKKTLLGG